MYAIYWKRKKKREDSKMLLLLQISPRLSICHCPSSNETHMYPEIIPFFLKVPSHIIAHIAKEPISIPSIANPFPFQFLSLRFTNPYPYHSIPYHTIPISIRASHRNHVISHTSHYVKHPSIINPIQSKSNPNPNRPLALKFHPICSVRHLYQLPNL